MEINKVQWRMIAKGAKLPCDSFLMKKDGTMTSMVTGAGVTVGQDAYYLPVEELRSFPKEESEDERMIQYFKDLAPFDKAEELYEKYGFSHNDAIDWLEKQAEQKPDDKVEQKFKVGDWVVYDHIPYQVVELPKEGYINLGLKGNGKVVYAPSTYCRLWTIQDARDGDVLADGLPFIFKKIDSMMHSYAYCGISVDDGFKIESEGEYGEWTWMQDIKPATKEQRDTLMKAIADAGYTFDFENKELKKVEQNPWSEEDEQAIEDAETWLDTLCDCLKDNSPECISVIKDVISELKSLKARILPQPKQEWSEEDEKMIGNIRRIIEQYALSKSAVDVNGELCEKEFIDADNWLKSLRPQSHWKPSGEQMEALKDALNNAIWQYDFKGSPIKEEITRKHAETIESLYNDLKKLIEE